MHAMDDILREVVEDARVLKLRRRYRIAYKNKTNAEKIEANREGARVPFLNVDKEYPTVPAAAPGKPGKQTSLHRAVTAGCTMPGSPDTVVALLQHVAKGSRVSTAEFLNTRNARGLTARDEAATKLEEVKAEFRTAQNMPHTKKRKDGREDVIVKLADAKFKLLLKLKHELDRLYCIAQILHDIMDYDADEDLHAGLMA